MDFKALQDQVQAYINKAKESVPKIADQAKAGNVLLPELLLVTTLYLGGFAIITILLPSLATLVYGGDGDPDYYSNDWAKFGAISNLALALFAAIISRWEAGLQRDEILRGFAFFFALDAVFNLLTLLYGSLSFICLLNAVVTGGLAFFYAKHSGLVPSKTH